MRQRGMKVLNNFTRLPMMACFFFSKITMPDYMVHPMACRGLVLMRPGSRRIWDGCDDPFAMLLLPAWYCELLCSGCMLSIIGSQNISA